MCLILFAWRAHPRYRLVLAANRDEYYARPAEAMAWWDDAPLLAGRDLEAGGTWLGLARGGRFAALTNVRDPAAFVAGRPSRGQLVPDWLRHAGGVDGYLAALAARGADYNGFNLLAGDREALWYYGNRSGEPPCAVAAGIHGLSNHRLDTPWPKVHRGTEGLARLLDRDAVEPEALLELLADRTAAPDAELPDTGVGLEWERQLSPLFIETERYGTRCSTVLLLEAGGGGLALERDVISGATRRFVL